MVRHAAGSAACQIINNLINSAEVIHYHTSLCKNPAFKYLPYTVESRSSNLIASYYIGSQELKANRFVVLKEEETEKI